MGVWVTRNISKLLIRLLHIKEVHALNVSKLINICSCDLQIRPCQILQNCFQIVWVDENFLKNDLIPPLLFLVLSSRYSDISESPSDQLHPDLDAKVVALSFLYPYPIHFCIDLENIILSQIYPIYMIYIQLLADSMNVILLGTHWNFVVKKNQHQRQKINLLYPLCVFSTWYISCTTTDCLSQLSTCMLASGTIQPCIEFGYLG